MGVVCRVQWQAEERTVVAPQLRSVGFWQRRPRRPRHPIKKAVWCVRVALERCCFGRSGLAYARFAVQNAGIVGNGPVQADSVRNGRFATGRRRMRVAGRDGFGTRALVEEW
jgi:hypothetical protein